MALAMTLITSSLLCLWIALGGLEVHPLSFANQAWASRPEMMRPSPPNSHPSRYKPEVWAWGFHSGL